MSIDARLRRAAAALDRSVQEVDAMQHLAELQGRHRRQRLTAVAVSVALLLVVAVAVAVAVTAFYLGRLLARKGLDPVTPTPRSLGRVVAVIPATPRSRPAAAARCGPTAATASSGGSTQPATGPQP